MRWRSLHLLALLSTASSADAEPPPWEVSGRAGLPPGAESVDVLRNDEPLMSVPSADGERRGSAAVRARLPLYGIASGPGCERGWLLVGPSAWICGDHVRLDGGPALPPDASEHSADGLPLRYFLVGENGTLGYQRLAMAEETAPDAELQPGFAVAIVQVASKYPTDPFGLTTKGLWLPMRDLEPIEPPPRLGITLAGDEAGGWVHVESAPLYRAPGVRHTPPAALERFAAVRVLERHRAHGRLWCRIGDEHWLAEKDLRVRSPAAPPPEALPGERWIDVDLSSQILTAFEGTQPVFATLVSTGKGHGNHPLATPRGTHRIWVKLRTRDMTNLEDREASRYYAIEEVPWVMFFKGGYGLHGAFWHRSFGHVRSHGCVNLPPADARWLFEWASPRLPAGWTAVLPTDYDPGTLVRVR